MSVDREPSVLGKSEDRDPAETGGPSETEQDDPERSSGEPAPGDVEPDAEDGKDGESHAPERDALGDTSAPSSDARSEDPESRSDTEGDSDDRSDTEADPESRSDTEGDSDDRSDTEADPESRSDTEGDSDDRSDTEAGAATASPAEGDSPRPKRRARASEAPTFYVAGFWRRLGGGLIDLAIILPVSVILGWLGGAVSGIHLPESRHRGLDFWLDLLLANDPAFVGWLVLAIVVGCVYLMVFHTVMGRTLGMRATKTRIIDLYGDPPTVARAGIRTGGYLVGLVTLGLGFIWIGFDSEKRGVQDWMAGTYVIKD